MVAGPRPPRYLRGVGTVFCRSVALCAVLLAHASVAHATNTKHERTPVIWDGGGGSCELPELTTPCMTLHDRGDGPLHIPYGIPYEDTDVGPDEVADSRTHQFLAFCRPHPIPEPIPSWMTQADVDAAEAVGQLEPGAVGPSDILELREDWDGCWYRINADADRRPITCEMAEQGVDWDTAAAPAGVYNIEAYTYEPQFNFWVLRPGVVKLHDGDPDAVGPAAAVTNREFSVHRNEIAMIEGCVDAIEGSTLTMYWARQVEVGQPIEWNEYAPGGPIEGPTFALEFAPPAPLVGGFGMLRIDVEDPQGRAYTAYMAERFVVVNADAPGGCDTGSFVGGSSCDESSGGSSGGTGDGADTSAGSTGGSTGGSTAGDTSSTTVAQAPGPGGCGCRHDGDRVGWTPWLVGLLVARRRRATR